MKRHPNTDAANFWTFARDYLCGYMPKVQGLSPKTIEAYRISLENYLGYLADIEHVEREHVGFEHFERRYLKGWVAQMVEERRYAAKTVTLAVERRQSVPGLRRRRRRHPDGAERISQNSQSPGRTQETDRILDRTPNPGSPRRPHRRHPEITEEPDAAHSPLRHRRPGLRNRRPDPRGPVPGRTRKGDPHRETEQDPVVPLTDRTIEHLRVYLAEFHPNPEELAAARPLFYSLHHGQATRLSTDTVSAVLKKAAATARGVSLRSREHPLSHAAKDQSHGPLPTRNPPAARHASPRPREHLHHVDVLRLRDPRHDARSHRRSQPRHQHTTGGTAHRRQTPSPLHPPIRAIR